MAKCSRAESGLDWLRFDCWPVICPIVSLSLSMCLCPGPDAVPRGQDTRWTGRLKDAWMEEEQQEQGSV